ncbi:hypothetical protein VMCG_10273 [Cytospora schulzeri]|uniref:Uncharacterized protein n=1 Tax=Cytospora schulzeri TaxID=448051 RepID=A0A423VAQ7_9PEZI|nr:hypothetical protein VMCG_10273 [Valsa malicola]
MLLLIAITYLALSSQLTSAAQCGAKAYGGTGPGNSCTGASLRSGAQNGLGTSECFQATNGACIHIVHEEDGGDCNVYTYDGLDCDSDGWNNSQDCTDEGDALQQNFGSFRIEFSRGGAGWLYFHNAKRGI